MGTSSAFIIITVKVATHLIPRATLSDCSHWAILYKNGESAEELFYNTAILHLWLQPLRNSCQGVHFQVAGFQPATLLKNKLLYRCFSMVLTAVEEQFSIFTSLDALQKSNFF